MEKDKPKNTGEMPPPSGYSLGETWTILPDGSARVFDRDKGTFTEIPPKKPDDTDKNK